jgi:hypothetical protein
MKARPGNAPVNKRLVFYVPGYDTEAETRYRKLFTVAFAQLARRFRVKRKIGSMEVDASIPAKRWTVVAEKGDWRTETQYEMLCWDDLVLRDVGRRWIYRLPLLFAALIGALCNRVVDRVFRIDWQFGLMMVYPWAGFLALVFASLALAYGVALLADLVVPIGVLGKVVIAVVLGTGILRVVDPWMRRFFLYLMLDAWIFNWQYGTGRRADVDARLDRFRDRIIDVLRQTDADEVLIVGHSTGTVVAVQLAARVLEAAPDLVEAGPPFALMTIGAALPLVGIFRKAEQLRQDVVRLVTSSALLWVDYQAAQDPLNARGFDPVKHFGLDLGGRTRHNPVTRSPRFKDLLTPETYKKIRYNFFRIHFQFLMANEVAGEYDYLMIVCGPVLLGDRVANPAMAITKTYGTDCSLPEYLSDGALNRDTSLTELAGAG